MIFEVLEVPGDDLETLSEMKGSKGALERCSRLPFCRSGEIFSETDDLGETLVHFSQIVLSLIWAIFTFHLIILELVL